MIIREIYRRFIINILSDKQVPFHLYKYRPGFPQMIKMKNNLSIKDIAKLTETSVTTVSFVINGKAKEKHISDSVIKKVQQKVLELGYQPNSFAKGLRTGKSNIIGFLVDDISKPFFADIARNIDEKASANGYKIIFSSIGNSKERAAGILKIFKDRQVDGYIIAVPEGVEDEVEMLLKTGVPAMLFDRYIPGVKADYVLTNNFRSTQVATNHLLDNGFRNIGFVTIETKQQQMLDRLNGYFHALSEKQLDSSVLKVNYLSSAHATQCIKAYLDANPNLDAIIFASNYLTRDGLELFKGRDKNLLASKAIISFDDFEVLEFLNPPITALRQPVESISTALVKLLLAKLEQPSPTKSVTYTETEFEGELILRASSNPK